MRLGKDILAVLVFTCGSAVHANPYTSVAYSQSLSKLTDGQLDLVQSTDDITTFVPGFTESKTIGSGNVYTIRNSVSSGVGASVTSGIQIGLNGMEYSGAPFGYYRLYDLKDVQIKYGNQYVELTKSIQGSLNVITAEPDDVFLIKNEGKIGGYRFIENTSVINMPLLDGNVSTRLAVDLSQREGMLYNKRTEQDYDDQNTIAARLSVKTKEYKMLPSIYAVFDYQKSNDHRPQEDAIACSVDPINGCSLNDFGQIGRTHGPSHFSSVVQFLALLRTEGEGILADYYENSPTVGNGLSEGESYLHRIPVHKQILKTNQVKLEKKLSTHSSLHANYTESTRSFFQMNDQDGSYPSSEFARLTTLSEILGAPVSMFSFETCYNGFCEHTLGPAIYDFSEVDVKERKGNIYYKSKFFDSVYLVGGGDYSSTKNSNVYRVHTASGVIMQDFNAHPIVKLLFGDELTRDYSGVPFYQDFLGKFALFVADLANPNSSPKLRAQLFESMVQPTTKPNTDDHGIINDQEVDSKTRSVYQTANIALTNNTFLFAGVNRQWRETVSKTRNDTLGISRQTQAMFEKLSDSTVDTALVRLNPDITKSTAVLDSYGAELSHRLTQGLSAYISYGSASRPGGVNAGDNPTSYYPEKHKLTELGGNYTSLSYPLQLNAVVFRDDAEQTIVAYVKNTGTINANIPAINQGFQGDAKLGLGNSTLMFSWLISDNAVQNTALADPRNPQQLKGDPIPFAQVGVPLPTGSTLFLPDPTAPSGDTVGVLNSGLTTYRWMYNDEGEIYADARSAGYVCQIPYSPNMEFVPKLVGYIYTLGCQEPESDFAKVDLTGNRMPMSSKVTLTSQLASRFEFQDFRINTRLIYHYKSPAYADIWNLERMKIASRHYADFYVSLSSVHFKNLETSVYVKNLSDKRAILSKREHSNVGGNLLSLNYSDPRTYSLSVKYSFEQKK